MHKKQCEVNKVKVNECIDKTARAVVAELKRSGMIRENRLNSFQKTEKILYEFPEWVESDKAETQRFVKLIEKALGRISSDPYYELIELKYFKGWTHERISEYFDVDVSVISKRRTKLINEIRPIIFSDEFIRELYEM